jgi:uncharacterized membrane protein YdjX (TVP38/TMEM64 family)/rhodanese-related sulfurtransferase
VNRRALLRLLPRLALALVLAGAIAWVVVNRDALDTASIEAWLRDVGPLAPALLVGIWVLATLLFFPGAVLGILGGALFGPAWGTLWNLTGATLGAALAFLAARYLAGGWVARRSGGRLGWLLTSVEAEGWHFVALTRLVPLFPFNLLNYALGLTRIGFWPYLATTLVCMVPGTFAYTWLGYAGREAVAGGEGLIQKILLAIGLLALVAFLPRLVRRFRRGGTRWTSAEALRQRLEQDAGLTVVDVRGPDEFAGPDGHIDGALNVPVDAIVDRPEAVGLDRTHAIVLVCKTDKRSARGAHALGAAGFADVTVLRGGMERWKSLGFARVASATDAPTPTGCIRP